MVNRGSSSPTSSMGCSELCRLCEPKKMSSRFLTSTNISTDQPKASLGNVLLCSFSQQLHSLSLRDFYFNLTAISCLPAPTSLSSLSSEDWLIASFNLDSRFFFLWDFGPNNTTQETSAQTRCAVRHPPNTAAKWDPYFQHFLCPWEVYHNETIVSMSRCDSLTFPLPPWVAVAL